MQNLYTPMIILIAMCFSPVVLHAQVLPWLEVGSEWIYQHGVWSGPEHYQVNYGITEQTTFAGQECAKMERLSSNGIACLSLQPPFYFYISNDSLYYANESDSTFRLVADFGASVGDSWEYHVITDIDNPVVVDTFLVTVTGVNMLNVQGEELRQLEMDYEWLGSSFYDEVWLGLYGANLTEVIGGEGFFAPFGQLGVCDYETNVTFQCFESPSFSYLNPEYPSCNYVVGTEESPNNQRLSIFPNPARDITQIEIPEQWLNHRGTVQLHNSTGQLVYEHSAVLSSFEYISVEALPRGMYLMTLQSEVNRGLAKIVVE